MRSAQVVTASLGAAAVALAIALAAPADAQRRSASPPANRSSRPPAKSQHKTAPNKPTHHHRSKANASPARSGVLAFAGCYGKFIAWRDELAGLMLEANSYTPWPDDRIRFDRMERAFAAAAKRDRKLTLTLQPAFHEEDFPPDIRAAFRAGLKTASTAFAASGYRRTQIVVVGQPDLSPRQRMAQLEANADEVFGPLAASCGRLAGG